MSERTESGHVPDLAVAGVVVVGVEPALVEELAASRAQVVVGAAAVDRDHERGNQDARGEALTPPLAARRAACEPTGTPFGWRSASRA